MHPLDCDCAQCDPPPDEASVVPEPDARCCPRCNVVLHCPLCHDD